MMGTDARVRRARASAFLLLVAASTVVGSAMMLQILAAGGFSPLEAVILALFVPTFAWIVVPFWTSIVGFVRMARGGLRHARPRRAEPVPPLTSRTAIVMPVFNEDPTSVAARLSAVARSLGDTGQASAFDLHLLSDTQDPHIARAEEGAWALLQARHPASRFHYRRRKRNRGRKAGNIAEFTHRCVDDYDHMVVLDADSVMDGPTLVRLASAMEADPEVGLIQTVPLPVRQRTLFGRIVQFAGCLYGPVLASGQAWWQGDTANYWGHNAIVRLRPFAEHADLPLLPGRPPLGGEVLSHDFVEAALLRRAGWTIVLDPTPSGSWEEVPTNVVDYARRDRRWAQGSLQHLRLLGLPGLHPLSRLHMLLGAFGYLTSPLWLLFLLAGTAYVFAPGLTGRSLGLPPVGSPGPVSLLAVTAAVLFAPKVLGLLIGTVFGPRRSIGSVAGVWISALLETGFSVLLAPLMMVAHTRFVVEIASGRSVRWDPALRTGGGVPWREALRVTLPATVGGTTWAVATWLVSPAFFVWMSPIFAGLVLAPWIVRWSASHRLGAAARRSGLFVSPFEAAPPPEIRSVDAVVDADPLPTTGVLVAPAGPTHDASMQDRRRMYNAERGLFDLGRGRPLFVRPSSADGASYLVAAVETLDEESLARLRDFASGPLVLVVTRHRASAMGLAIGAGEADTVALQLEADASTDRIRRLSAGPAETVPAPGFPPQRAPRGASVGLALARLARLIPAAVAAPVDLDAEPASDAVASGEILSVELDEVTQLIGAAGACVRRVSEAPVPLPDSLDSRFILFREIYGLAEHVAVVVGAPEDWPDPVPVRLHSACFTGDLFGSLRCDCGEQLEASMEVFRARGGGVLVYLAQEGRGIGLGNKFRAYTLQESGLDTIDADEALGFGADERRYEMAAQILGEVGVQRIDLLTNNPGKVAALEAAGITVVRRSALHGRLNPHNLPYVRAKVQRAGHWLGDMLSQELSGD